MDKNIKKNQIDIEKIEKYIKEQNIINKNNQNACACNNTGNLKIPKELLSETNTSKKQKINNFLLIFFKKYIWSNKHKKSSKYSKNILMFIGVMIFSFLVIKIKNEKIKNELESYITKNLLFLKIMNFIKKNKTIN